MALNMVTATQRDFEPFIGQTFIVQSEQGEVSIILCSVKKFVGSTVRDSHIEIAGVVHPPRKAFALTFEGPRDPVIETKTYVLEHKDIGEIELFLSAFRRDMTCMLYESVFN